jgi:hypothetical protein
VRLSQVSQAGLEPATARSFSCALPTSYRINPPRRVPFEPVVAGHAYPDPRRGRRRAAGRHRFEEYSSTCVFLFEWVGGINRGWKTEKAPEAAPPGLCAARGRNYRRGPEGAGAMRSKPLDGCASDRLVKSGLRITGFLWFLLSPVSPGVALFNLSWSGQHLPA